MGDYTKIKLGAFNLPKFLYFFAFILLIIESTLMLPLKLLQLNTLGTVYITNPVIKALAMGTMILYIMTRLMQNKKIKHDNLFYYYVFFVAFMLMSAIISILNHGYNLRYIASVFNTQLLLLLYIPITLFIPPEIGEKAFKKIIYLIASIYFINIYYVYMQYNGNVLSSTFDNEGNKLFTQQVFSSNIIRVNGAMNSGLTLGYLLVFCLSLFTSFLIVDKTKLKNRFVLLVGIGIAVWAIYLTYTRNIYLFAVFILFYIMAFKLLKGDMKKIFSWVYPLVTPIVYFVYASCYANYNIYSSGVTNVESFFIRKMFWQERIRDFLNGNLIDFLFGSFVPQIGSPNDTLFKYIGRITISDNMYLHNLNFIGIIGLILFLVLLWKVYSRLLKLDDEPIKIALCAYLGGVYTLGNMNIIESIYIFFGVYLSVLYIISKNPMESSPVNAS